MRLRPYRYSLLALLVVLLLGLYGTAEFMLRTAICPKPSPYRSEATARDTMIRYRSEERRVGKEGRARGGGGR